jgi:hypothetical protein
MSIRAIAFHESLAVEKLEDLFTSPESRILLPRRKVVKFATLPGLGREEVYMTFLGHARLSLNRASKDFGLGRDMLIGLALSLCTLILQVFWRLIPLRDWREHRWQWIASFALPFLAILISHIIWRLVSAPWRIHQDQEAVFSTAIQEKEDRIRNQAAENIELRKQLHEALDKHEGPKIHLLYIVPEHFSSLGKRENRIIIENSSDVDAYHVKIEDIFIDRNRVVTATFKEINLLRKNSKVTAELRMTGKVDPQDDENFEMIYGNADDIPTEYQLKDSGGYTVFTFPVFVSFREHDGKVAFRSEFLFTFNETIMGLRDVIKFVRCEKQPA